MERVDVVIVGGGPAGSAAGTAAATAGADAVVIEKGVPRADRDDIGPDSTDAAGLLDYWLDIARLDYRELPEEVIYQSIDRARFIGPSEHLTIRDTRRDADFPHFGLTFDRTRFDDWLRRRAEAAGADYRVGTSVMRVDSTVTGAGHSHVLTLRDGSRLGATFVILADGPQRSVTIPTLDQFMPEGHSTGDRLGPSTANHIAYQEYRRFPPAVFEPDAITFWWGWIPGETAYLWAFPNDEPIVRLGLTMPGSVDLDAIDRIDEYRLLRPGEGQIPRGRIYVRRLLEEVFGDAYDIEADFPLVENRGKARGSEAYPISSTRPIDSPTRAGIAVAGGAMGATSAFHEGGDHVAIRSGTVAGRLAGEGRLDAYNDAWKAAIGEEIVTNMALANLVRDYTPGDWDRSFAVLREMGLEENSFNFRKLPSRSGLAALRYFARAFWHRWRSRDGRYVQLREDEYDVDRS